MKDVRLAVGIAVALGVLWWTSRSSSAAALASLGMDGCGPGAKFVAPTDPLYVASLDHSSNKSGYCVVQGTVTYAGAGGPATAFGEVTSSLSGALNAGLAALGNFFKPSSSSGPITDPSQLADAGPSNTPSFDPLGDS